MSHRGVVHDRRRGRARVAVDLAAALALAGCTQAHRLDLEVFHDDAGVSGFTCPNSPAIDAATVARGTLAFELLRAAGWRYALVVDLVRIGGNISSCFPDELGDWCDDPSHTCAVVARSCTQHTIDVSAGAPTPASIQTALAAQLDALSGTAIFTPDQVPADAAFFRVVGTIEPCSVLDAHDAGPYDPFAPMRLFGCANTCPLPLASSPPELTAHLPLVNSDFCGYSLLNCASNWWLHDAGS